LSLPFVISSAMATFIKVTKGALEFLAFENAMYLFFVFIPVMDETRDDLRRRDRTISKVEEGTIQRNCGPMKKNRLKLEKMGCPKHCRA